MRRAASLLALAAAAADDAWTSLVPRGVPVVDYVAAAPVGAGETATLAFTIHHRGRRDVLLQVDGAPGRVVCEASAAACAATARVAAAAPGWHAAALLIGAPDPAGYANLTAASLPFFVAGPLETRPAREPRPCDGARGHLSVHVVALDRPAALLRLLRSLAAAAYDGATVPLTVHVDGPRGRGEAAGAAARTFEWPHGPYAVRERDANVGATANRLEAWVPPSPCAWGAFFEDDVTVDARWARFLGAAAAAYPAAEGVVFQRNWLSPAVYLRESDALNAGQPYLSPVLGPYAHAVRGDFWIEFRRWYGALGPAGDAFARVAVPGWSFTNAWVAGNFRRGLWTAYVDRFLFDSGRRAPFVYANPPAGGALATNHHDGPGLHYPGTKGRDAAPLDGGWVSRGRLWHLPPRPTDVDATGRPARRRGVAAAAVAAAVHPWDVVGVVGAPSLEPCGAAVDVVVAGPGAVAAAAAAPNVERPCAAAGVEIADVAVVLGDAAGLGAPLEAAAAAGFVLGRAEGRGGSAAFVLERPDAANPVSVVTRTTFPDGGFEIVATLAKYGAVQDLR